MFKKVCLFFLISVMSLSAQTDFKLIAESAVKAKSGEGSALIELYKQSLDTKNAPLRKYLVKAVLLSMLKNSSKATSAYLQKITSVYPSENLLSFLEIPPLKNECNKCQGFSIKLENCQKCKEGKCKNCKGIGAIVYGNGKSRKESPCVQCKSTGHCKSCMGSSQVSAKCKVCRGQGVLFNKIAVGSETHRALNVLLNKTYELDDDPGTVFDVKVFEADKKVSDQGKLWLAARKNKAAEWVELEKKRQASVKKKQLAKTGPNYITTTEEAVVESYEEGGSTSTLDHICLEIKEYLRAQELKSKRKFLIKVYGQFLSDIATVHVVVDDNFAGSEYDYKLRAADGFYKFSALRAQANGYEAIDFKLLSRDGMQIGGVNEKGFWIKK